MPLETGTYLPDLNASNPAHTDGVNQADSHLRLIKSVLKNTFPNFTDVALGSTQAALDAAVAALAGVFLVAADGTISAPAYSFASEHGLGFYRKAANTLALAIAGVDVWKISGAGVDIIAANALLASGVAIFPLQSANIGNLQVLTAALAANAVTYAKLQNASANKVLIGGPTAGAALQEITMGTGVDIVAGALTNTIAAQPPVAYVQNLIINNDGSNPNTKINITADSVSLLDGSNNSQRYFNVSVSLDFTTTGANGCDVGSRAANKGYYIWLIGNGSTVASIATLDTNAAPTLPGGYTAQKRVAWYRTDGSSNLYRIVTRGANARYQVTGSGTGVSYPLITNGISGSSGTAGSPVYASISLSGFIPANAQEVTLVAVSNYNGNAVTTLAIAGSTHNGAFNGTNPPNLYFDAVNTVQSVSFPLEALSFGYWANGAGGAAFCSSWINPL